MGRPKLPTGEAKDKLASVRLDPATYERLERLQLKLSPPVELTLGQVLRAVIDRGLEQLDGKRR